MIIGLFYFIFGFVIAMIIVKITRKKHTVGNLRIDNSDNYDGPYVFMEIKDRSKGIFWICRQKYVVLDVRVEDYISRE